MAKRKRYKKSSKCPEPINTLLDFAGAATLGMYVKHKVKKDFQNGRGEESAKAAAAVFGFGSVRRGSQGIINLGGLVGLNSALKDIENQSFSERTADHSPFVSPIEREPAILHPVGLWRERCEDGTAYGTCPYDYENADDYEDALIEAKQNLVYTNDDRQNHSASDNPSNPRRVNQYRWRLYCEDGSKYVIKPENYETADDYKEAIENAKANAKDK